MGISFEFLIVRVMEN